MTDRRWQTVWTVLLTAVKIAALLFVGIMIVVQIPELRYDLGPKQPLAISGIDDLDTHQIKRATFASIQGTPDFERAFVYQRYGLTYTYFILEPYGIRMVVRTYENVTDDWKSLNRFVGKLNPFDRQPFSYRVRAILLERFNETVPEGAYFLALKDVPKISGWQVGAVVFASVMWLVMFLVFFIIRWNKPRVRTFPKADAPS